ncbi:PhlD [Streptomyces sp. NBC_00237]|uniref:PhlD n=1 Tax=Streptomyces sp. NBC_00237 TaxID=2975687 RepID=UPI0022566DF2|nr:PhlD [Streptomyces sp. NBC_00237]MCX5206188.1 PhlD [Streptomyces sp. NBC_00237]
MSGAFVSRPAVVLADHLITTESLLEDLRTRHADHPRLKAFERVVANCGVDTRYLTRPLDHHSLSAGATVTERTTIAFGDALTMAENAAREVLDAHGLGPGDIDAIITSHTTSWGIPNMDVRLTNALGLRPDVRHLAMTTLACAGGAQALIRAADMVAARPGSTVLVVVTEVISSVCANPHDTSIEAIIYRALFGDSAGAALVTSSPLGRGLRIDDTWEYTLPESTDRYYGRLDHTGLHFDSTKAATKAAGDVLPRLLDWVGPRDVLDWAVIHPGSPRIITDIATGFGLDHEDTRRSRTSLAENGNLGGNAVLDVLRRTHDEPPADGSAGIMAAFGPGFSTAALRGTWQETS